MSSKITFKIDYIFERRNSVMLLKITLTDGAALVSGTVFGDLISRKP